MLCSFRDTALFPTLSAVHLTMIVHIVAHFVAGVQPDSVDAREDVIQAPHHQGAQLKLSRRLCSHQRRIPSQDGDPWPKTLLHLRHSNPHGTHSSCQHFRKCLAVVNIEHLRKFLVIDILKMSIATHPTLEVRSIGHRHNISGTARR